MHFSKIALKLNLPCKTAKISRLELEPCEMKPLEASTGGESIPQDATHGRTRSSTPERMQTRIQRMIHSACIQRNITSSTSYNGYIEGPIPPAGYRKLGTLNLPGFKHFRESNASVSLHCI